MCRTESSGGDSSKEQKDIAILHEILHYYITMAIILPTKKLQPLLEKKEPFVVFTHNKSGVIRVVGMKEYLEEEKQELP
jgi:hypothetical protein